MDLTSQMQRGLYAALAVPELWIYDQDQLKIYVLRNGIYEESPNSLSFPELAIAAMVSTVIEPAQTLGYSQALLKFETEFSQSIHS